METADEIRKITKALEEEKSVYYLLLSLFDDIDLVLCDFII